VTGETALAAVTVDTAAGALALASALLKYFCAAKILKNNFKTLSRNIILNTVKSFNIKI